MNTTKIAQNLINTHGDTNETHEQIVSLTGLDKRAAGELMK